MKTNYLSKVNEISVYEQLTIIWNDIFKINEINPEDDFFRLGGNSLTAAKFISKVEEVFGAESLSPEALYESPRFKDIVASVNIHRIVE